MSLGDVVVERHLSTEETLEAICLLWDLKAHEVLIVNDLAELVATSTPRRVLCHKWYIEGGQFATVLSFYEGEFMEQSREETAVNLCKILRCRCLVSDASDNPYKMVLFYGSGQAQVVNLNREKLDNGTYEITKLMDGKRGQDS